MKLLAIHHFIWPSARADLAFFYGIQKSRDDRNTNTQSMTLNNKYDNIYLNNI